MLLLGEIALATRRLTAAVAHSLHGRQRLSRKFLVCSSGCSVFRRSDLDEGLKMQHPEQKCRLSGFPYLED